MWAGLCQLTNVLVKNTLSTAEIATFVQFLLVTSPSCPKDVQNNISVLSDTAPELPHLLMALVQCQCCSLLFIILFPFFSKPWLINWSHLPVQCFYLPVQCSREPTAARN